MANSTLMQPQAERQKQVPVRQKAPDEVGWWTEVKGGRREGRIWDLELGQHIIKPDMGNPFLKKGQSVSERVACSAMIREGAEGFVVLRHTSGNDGVTYKCKEGDVLRLSNNVELKIEKIDFGRGYVAISIDKKA